MMREEQSSTSPSEYVPMGLDFGEDGSIIEIRDGVSPKIRSCKSCVKAHVCSIYINYVQMVEHLKGIAKTSQVTLDLFPPEHIGQRCSGFISGTTKEQTQ